MRRRPLRPKSTPAHDQKLTIRIVEHFPAHEPREGDPRYHLFEKAKRRIKDAALWRCAVCGATDELEAHHSWVEFAFQNGISVKRLNTLLGLHLDDESFKDWVESEGNLEILCREHHRGTEGIHSLPEPVWNAVRLWKEDTPPAEVI